MATPPPAGSSSRLRAPVCLGRVGTGVLPRPRGFLSTKVFDCLLLWGHRSRIRGRLFSTESRWGRALSLPPKSPHDHRNAPPRKSGHGEEIVGGQADMRDSRPSPLGHSVQPHLTSPEKATHGTRLLTPHTVLLALRPPTPQHRCVPTPRSLGESRERRVWDVPPLTPR